MTDISRDLVERLRGEKGPLAKRITDEMYEDPFWTARFATRGRKHSEEDAGFHVDYLVQALVARDAGVMERYARWLQNVLTTRGMCTLHLDESLARLERAIAERIPEPAPATKLLVAARAALLYPEGPARELQDASPWIVDRAIAALGGERDARHHLASLVSYLAHAIALSRPAVWRTHVAWLGGFLGGRDVSPSRLDAWVAAIVKLLDDDHPSLRAAARAILDAREDAT